MKKIIYAAWVLFMPFWLQGQAYRDGEYLKYKVHYFFINAGYASLGVEETHLNGQPVFHATGLGKSTALSSLVMDVDDRYESYFDRQNRPLKFIRKVHEGDYRKDVELDFDHQRHLVKVIDKLHHEVQWFHVPEGVQDMLSSYYALRNVDASRLKKGDFIDQDLFFDNELYHFRMKVLGRETIRTKYGWIRTIVLRPYVQAERVFKEEESLTVWVSDDENKIPLRIKAKLLVGSIKADLVEYRNLKYPIHFSETSDEAAD